MQAVADPNQVDRLSVGRVAVLELSGSIQGENKAVYLGKAGSEYVNSNLPECGICEQ